MNDKEKKIAYLCRETEKLNLEIEAINNDTYLLKKGETKKGLTEILNKQKANHSKAVMQYIEEHIKNSGLEPIFFNYLMSAIKHGDLIALGFKEYTKDTTENLTIYQTFKIALMVRYYSTNRQKGDRNSKEFVRDKICEDKVYLGVSVVSAIYKKLTESVDVFIKKTDPSPKCTKKGKLRLQSMPSDQEIASFLDPIKTQVLLHIEAEGEKILGNTDRSIPIPYLEW